MNLVPDVEVIFNFENNKKENIFDGYRPAHLIKDNYLTTGKHNYYSESEDGILRGTIVFISPEEYPKCLWVGKKIKMYEGKEYIGYATIEKIFNDYLKKI